MLQVRRELGSGAVVLHTRVYQVGGFLGFGRRNVVEVTAGDGRELGRQRRQEATRTAPSRLRITARETLEDVTDTPAGDLIRKTYAAARAELQSQHAPTMSAAPPAPPAAAPAAPPAAVSPGHQAEQFTQEIKAVRAMVMRLMRTQGPAFVEQAAGPADQLFQQYLALLEQEVSEEVAEEIVAQVRAELSGDEVKNAATCKAAVREKVAKLLPAVEAVEGRLSAAEDGRPQTIALIGPTGVGKTTTIAKLAANFKLKQNRRVGLITLDTYRIAAVEQLRTYASIIGVPLHVVATPDELHRATAACAAAGCEVILIDTAGRSQRDDARLQELATYLEVAQPHEVHLVLSSTCTQKVLIETAERFSSVRTDSIIFTKLDEAVSFGVLVNVAKKVNKRLSYITTGQEVPHDIERSRPERVAALVMGEEPVQL